MKPHWVPANSYKLLENGEDFYPCVFQSIRSAQHEVLLESFIIFDDPVGQELRAALLYAAQRGVTVHVLVDGWGSPDLRAEFLQPLLDAGVQWRVFEPARRWFGYRVNPLRRMHRKLVVVDGETAFVGGINYAHDHLATFGPQAKQDYAVRLRGPVVEQVHAFCKQQQKRQASPKQGGSWSRWRQRWKDRRAYALATASAKTGKSTTGWAAFVVRDNGLHRSDIERQYRLALRKARHRVLIANAYFFPGYRLLRDLRRAAKRGVQVDLILQGQPDMPIAQSAASMLYAWLCKSGIRIHEYCERPLHGKVAVVDGQWATVGSSNLDPTSLGLNLEANVLINDHGFAAELQNRLQHLIAEQCQAVRLDSRPNGWPWWARFRTTLLYHLLRWWPQVMHALPAQKPAVQPQRKAT